MSNVTQSLHVLGRTVVRPVIPILQSGRFTDVYWGFAEVSSALSAGRAYDLSFFIFQTDRIMLPF